MQSFDSKHPWYRLLKIIQLLQKFRHPHSMIFYFKVQFIQLVLKCHTINTQLLSTAPSQTWRAFFSSQHCFNWLLFVNIVSKFSCFALHQFQTTFSQHTKVQVQLALIFRKYVLANFTVVINWLSTKPSCFLWLLLSELTPLVWLLLVLALFTVKWAYTVMFFAAVPMFFALFSWTIASVIGVEELAVFTFLLKVAANSCFFLLST